MCGYAACYFQYFPGARPRQGPPRRICSVLFKYFVASARSVPVWAGALTGPRCCPRITGTSVPATSLCHTPFDLGLHDICSTPPILGTALGSVCAVWGSFLPQELAAVDPTFMIKRQQPIITVRGGWSRMEIQKNDRHGSNIAWILTRCGPRGEGLYR
jgi:hypothetical protein